MEENLSVLHRQLNIVHRIAVQECLDQYGLYIGQPRFLFALAEQPGMSQAQLSQRLSLSKETVSVTLRRLEQAGFVRRESSDQDKRIKLLYLSDSAELVMPKLRKEFNIINESMFSLLDSEEKVILESLFLKMTQGIERSFDR